jgi:predicted aspartyl protease
MGLIYAVTEVTNIRGDGGKYAMPFLVDTGATVLESAGFIVDPTRQILTKTAAIPLK